MKYCPSLYGALNIENSNIFLCCAAKRNMPTIPWDIKEGLPLDRIHRVRGALIKALNEDMNKPIAEYATYGHSGYTGGHPCKGCRYIVEKDDDFEAPPTSKLFDFLNLGAFTFCNANCVYCNAQFTPAHQRSPRLKTPPTRGREMEQAVFKAVEQLFEADAISTSCRIIFASGEPSASKGFMKILADVVRKGFPVLINTNAIRYAPEIEEALKSGKAEVQVSLDSGDRQSFLAVKGIDSFDQVADNIDRYAAAVRGGSILWIKYIIFSQNNSPAIAENFVTFCRQHRIKNVVLTTNTFEGELGVDRQEEDVESQTLKVFGSLAARLQFMGVDVFQEYHFLTQNEQDQVEREYARAVMQGLGYPAEAGDDYKEIIIGGLEMSRLPVEDARSKVYMSNILQRAAADAKGIALFGAGGHAQWISALMESLGIQPLVALDNNPADNSRFAFPVISLAESYRYDFDTVLIASNAYHLSIYAQLMKMEEFADFRLIDPYLNLAGLDDRPLNYN